MSERLLTRLAVPLSFAFFAASAAIFRLSSYDIWWHLATGRLILSGGGIPRSDPFSYTARGAEWIDHEWLFQCLTFALHSLGGPPMLVLAKAAAILATATLAWRFARRETALPAAAVSFLLIPFVLAGRDRFLVRPELFTILFSMILLTTLLKSRDAPPTWRDLWWVPPLFALWANLHAGVIVGLILLAAFLCGRVMQGLPLLGNGRKPQWEELRTLGTVLLAAAGAGLVNPFLYRVYQTPFQLTKLIESGIFDNLEWRHPSLSSQWLFYAVLVASMVVAIHGVRRRDWPAVLTLLFLAAIAIKYVRNIALFSLLAPVILARIAGHGEEAPTTTARRRLPLATISPALVALLLCGVGIWMLFGSYRFPSGLGVSSGRVPEKGVDFIERVRPQGHLYNVYGFGGYVAWRLWPAVEIFIDGRNEVFVEVRKQLGEAVGDSRKWTALLDEYGVSYALVSYARTLEEVTIVDPEGGPPTIEHWPYTVTHFPRRSWALVHWDDVSMVYLRRDFAAHALIEEHEIANVFPHEPAFQVEAISRGWADLGGCIRELGSKLEQDPECRRAASLMERVVGEFQVQQTPGGP